MQFRGHHSLPPIILSLILSSPVYARTWYITPGGSGDAPTIQAGIDSAAAGDEVRLAPGLYTWTSQGATGTSMIRLKPAVTLRSEAGASATILDAEARGRVVLCQDAGNQLRIEGLTLQNGFVSHGGPDPGGGGGLLAVGDSEPTVLGCVIQDNHAFRPSNGGGIYCNVATIDSCSFLDNDGFRGYGGAVACGAARITNCEFKRNGQGDGGGGGAIAASSAIIRDCVFEDNGVGSGMLAPGGAIAAAGATTIESCLFVRNIAFGVFGEGGAISFFGPSGVVRNSVFIGNAALGGGPNRGGAIGASEGALIENCTILAGSGDHADGIGGIWMQGGTVRNVILGKTTAGQACGGTATWICCDLFENVLGDTICGIDGGGNFSADPAFCAIDPISSQSVALQADSPCAPGRHPTGDACELIGASPVACGPVAVNHSSWGAVKSLYR